MARPREYPPRSGTTIRFAPDLHDRLVAAARERDLSANFLANRAVEEFLDRLIPVDELRFTRDTPTNKGTST